MHLIIIVVQSVLDASDSLIYLLSGVREFNGFLSLPVLGIYQFQGYAVNHPVMTHSIPSFLPAIRAFVSVVVA